MHLWPKNLSSLTTPSKGACLSNSLSPLFFFSTVTISISVRGQKWLKSPTGKAVQSLISAAMITKSHVPVQNSDNEK